MSELKEAKKILFETMRFQGLEQVLFSGGKITDQSALIETVVDAMQQYAESYHKAKLREKIKTIEERKKTFGEKLKAYIPTYSMDMLKEFFDYWTEHGEKDKKMRFEKETSFDIKLRLERWHRNSKPKITNLREQTKQTSLTVAQQLFKGELKL